MPSLQALMPEWQARIESRLDHWLPSAERHPLRLHAAMRYACLGGGKRIRPLLIYATGLATGQDLRHLDGIACAVEMIHVYSLIHDDLPCMDDDDLRRGKPTCHKAFDEATAVLAGDALQALAFYILSHDPDISQDPAIRLSIVAALARAAGSRGMAGGQAIDLASVGKRLSIVELEAMHIFKTGALIRASVMMAASTRPELGGERLDALDHYAKCVGLAFQIRDDILDVVGDTETLGKTAGADHALDKPTFPDTIGLEASRDRARELCEEALAHLDGFGSSADVLRDIARYIVERIY
ncbi:MAG: polyprenyl synthetase family protein [Thiotrichales bacterium]